MYDAHELLREPNRSRIWPSAPRDQPGIDWNQEGQLRFLGEVARAHASMDFPIDKPDADDVYYIRNDQYPLLDAWVLESILRHAQPRRIIEVGAGYSTLVTARVNREHLGCAAEFTSIEPYPRPFLTRGLKGLSSLLVDRIENVDLTRFEALAEDDILFIDTSHVVRTGNDVTWIYAQVLPRLGPGVYVHIHDVFLPGDYPQPWVAAGWGWNENYLVEAFLQFNTAYEVVIGVHWALQHARAEMFEAFPDTSGLGTAGSALWLRRV